MNRHTYEAGLVGNCAYLAHIDRNTNVNWLCWPRFDSSFIFGGLLDSDAGGEFSIRPPEAYTSRQYYLENTNILCTEISTEHGSYRITDFAPRFTQYERNFKPLMLIRKIEPLDGLPRIQVVCKPVYDYGRCQLREHQGSNHIGYTGGGDMLRLTTNIPISYLINKEPFILNDTRHLILTYGNPLEAPLESTAEHFLTETTRYWRTWIKQSAI